MAENFARFTKASPLPVMALVTLEDMTSDELLDQPFERQASANLLLRPCNAASNLL